MKVEDPVVFLAYDVEQLYPSIDLKDALSVLVNNVPALSALCGLWIKILKLIMYNNCVTANGEIYRQMSRTATCTQLVRIKKLRTKQLGTKNRKSQPSLENLRRRPDSLY